VTARTSLSRDVLTRQAQPPLLGASATEACSQSMNRRDSQGSRRRSRLAKRQYLWSAGCRAPNSLWSTVSRTERGIQDPTTSSRGTMGTNTRPARTHCRSRSQQGERATRNRWGRIPLTHSHSAHLRSAEHPRSAAGVSAIPHLADATYSEAPPRRCIWLLCGRPLPVLVVCVLVNPSEVEVVEFGLLDADAGNSLPSALKGVAVKLRPQAGSAPT